MTGPRHPATEGNILAPEDVLIPDPNGEGKVSIVDALGGNIEASVVLAQEEPPDNQAAIWVDTTQDPDEPKIYRPDSNEWKPLEADLPDETGLDLFSSETDPATVEVERGIRKIVDRENIGTGEFSLDLSEEVDKGVSFDNIIIEFEHYHDSGADSIDTGNSFEYGPIKLNGEEFEDTFFEKSYNIGGGSSQTVIEEEDLNFDPLIMVEDTLLEFDHDEGSTSFGVETINFFVTIWVSVESNIPHIHIIER